jgi:hypothetical protein
MLQQLRIGCVMVLFWGSLSAGRAASVQTLQIDADYPGGNIVMEAVEGDTVTLRPDLRDTEGWWFYWNFRVTGAAGRSLRFEFAERSPIGTRGPAVSLDGGQSWTWLGQQHVDGRAFRYTFGAQAKSVRFCFSVPYQQADLDRFMARHRDSARLKVDRLCDTRQGRAVECLTLGRLDGRAAHRILVTARHHACESMASYVLEGLMQEILQPAGAGTWLAQHCEFVVIPFMDKDGVEHGDQGKNRRPHDHNRDYRGESIYPSVRALRKRAEAWSAGELSVALDLHCPYLRGSNNESIYMVGSRRPAVWQQQCRLGDCLEAACRGPLRYRAADNLPYGQAWNTAKNYQLGKSFSQWAGDLPGIRVAACIEFPYANVLQETVTAENARSFGSDLAAALVTYLQTPNH